jgi:O-glycosyl hydrolase
VNAWHYWWIAPRGDQRLANNSALTNGTSLARRAHVVGNFSKFVRPDFVRVRATGAPQRDVLVTAFRNEPGDVLVVVAINFASNDIEQVFEIEEAELEGVVPWITSDDLALEEQAEEAVVEGSFRYALPARSVTTFVAGTANLGEPQEEPVAVPPRPVSNQTGCSCRLPLRRGGNPPAVAVFGAGLLALRARRRAA